MARYDTEHKAQTRRRIIETAGRRLKRDGIDGSGSRCAHDRCGADQRRVLRALRVQGRPRRQRGRRPTELPSVPSSPRYPRAGRRWRNSCASTSSPQHRDDPSTGCPNAALLDEIGRCDDAVRDSYTEGMQSIVDVIATHLSPQDPPPREPTRWGCSRSSSPPCNSPAPSPTGELSDDILESGIRNALALLENGECP